MKIHLETQGFEPTPAIKSHVTKQLRLNLANFDSHIVAVHVFLRDINGPKGGADMKTLIRVMLDTRHSINVESTRNDLYAAVVVAARQAKRSVRRSLNKHRRMEKLALRHMRQFPQY